VCHKANKAIQRCEKSSLSTLQLGVTKDNFFLAIESTQWHIPIMYLPLVATFPNYVDLVVEHCYTCHSKSITPCGKEPKHTSPRPLTLNPWILCVKMKHLKIFEQLFKQSTKTSWIFATFQ
jgi:hypothetical protein